MMKNAILLGGLYLRDGGIYKLSPIEVCKVMGVD